jgi:quercetin dioxygenase-like cupin family protein
MRYKETLLVLLVLTAGTLTAQQPTVQQVKVTPLLSKALPETPGKEVVMITVEYAPGGSDPIHRHHTHGFICHAGQRRKGSGAESGRNFL